MTDNNLPKLIEREENTIYLEDGILVQDGELNRRRNEYALTLKRMKKKVRE